MPVGILYVAFDDTELPSFVAGKVYKVTLV